MIDTLFEFDSPQLYDAGVGRGKGKLLGAILSFELEGNGNSDGLLILHY